MGPLDEICNYCSEKCENLKAIDENTKHVFEIFLPKIDFTLIQGSVMCKNCVEVLLKCYEFKIKCLRTHDYIVPLVNKGDVQLDLKDVYRSKNNTNTDTPEDEGICGLCLSLVKNCSAVSVDVEESDVILQKMIEQCLPELDLSIIKKPLICPPCHRSLENCFYFVTKYLIVEENDKKYCETLDINSKSQRELNSLSQFMIRDVAANEVDGNSVDIKEEQFCGDRKNSDVMEIGEGGDMTKLEPIYFCDIKSEDIKNEIATFGEFDDQKVNSKQEFALNNTWTCDKETDKLGYIKIEEIFCEENETKCSQENLVEMEAQFLVNGELEIKTDKHDNNRIVNDIVLPHSEVSGMLQKREEYLMPSLEGDLSSPSIERALTNKKNVHSSEVITYNCDFCSYQTKYKNNLKNHLLVHKNPSEITMYKCDSCTYQTKYNRNLKCHLLVHKNPSEITMYKCDSCTYQTKYNKHLKIHLQVHKDPSEICTVYKCNSCSFQTKHKRGLKSHLLSHRDPSEVNMYKCDSCSYQTKYNKNLKSHLLIHKNASEVTMYKCDSCSYQTKTKYALKSHFMIHKDPSEATMYKCDSCSFQSSHNNAFKNHLLSHKNSSETMMYKCDSCSFQARYKNHLEQHLLKHKNPSELTVYKCDSCPFQTKYKHELTRHLVNHKDPSEVTMYVCDSCPFQTKRKASLVRHYLTHKDPSEIIMHKCDSCSFQTKRKYHLKRHKLTHQSWK